MQPLRRQAGPLVVLALTSSLVAGAFGVSGGTMVRQAEADEMQGGRGAPREDGPAPSPLAFESELEELEEHRASQTLAPLSDRTEVAAAAWQRSSRVDAVCHPVARCDLSIHGARSPPG